MWLYPCLFAWGICWRCQWNQVDDCFVRASCRVLFHETVCSSSGLEEAVESSPLQSAFGFPPVQAHQSMDDVWTSPPMIGASGLKAEACFDWVKAWFALSLDIFRSCSSTKVIEALSFDEVKMTSSSGNSKLKPEKESVGDGLLETSTIVPRPVACEEA